jgi:hypothetical protein
MNNYNDEYDDISIRDISIRNESSDDELLSEEGENNNNSVIIEENNNKKRGKGKTYKLVQQYETLEDAMIYMNKDFLNENNLKKGSKNVSSCKNCVQNFRCKENGCPFCYRLIINNNEEKVKLEKCTSDHNHEGFDQHDWDVLLGSTV